MSAHINDDIVIACADLVGRAGASGFDMGFVRDDVPVEQAGWYATAYYQGARIMVEEQPSPTAAAIALAQRLLRGAACRCGKVVSLSDGQPGCRWRLAGPRWEPGCDAPPLTVSGGRGDLGAIRAAAMNRQQRRAADKRKGRR